jgi:preprotein translocase subunit SecF
MNIFPKVPNFDIIGQRRFWISVSIFLTVVIFLWPAFKKPNWGVDFAGGNEIQVQFSGDVDPGKIHDAVDASGLTDTNIQALGDTKDHEFLIRVGRSSLFKTEQFKQNIEPKIRAALPDLAPDGVSYNETEGDQITLTGKEGATLTPESIRKAIDAAGLKVQDIRAVLEGHQYSVVFRGVSDQVQQALQKSFPELKPTVRRVEQVGASVGTELKIAAVKSIVVAILMILVYVGFRFDFAFATGAIVSLIHDAVIVTGFYLISGSELNNSTIAAVLTIIGYSVNDTVIIYDRIRENLTKHKGRELTRVINDSINETLSRTIITHFTVLLSLAGLIAFTIGTLREFSLAMAVGVITGTYSSVYIASPVVIWIDDVLKARKERAALEEKNSGKRPDQGNKGDGNKGDGGKGGVNKSSVGQVPAAQQ